MTELYALLLLAARATGEALLEVTTRSGSYYAIEVKDHGRYGVLVTNSAAVGDYSGCTVDLERVRMERRMSSSAGREVTELVVGLACVHSHGKITTSEVQSFSLT